MSALRTTIVSVLATVVVAGVLGMAINASALALGEPVPQPGATTIERVLSAPGEAAIVFVSIATLTVVAAWILGRPKGARGDDA